MRIKLLPSGTGRLAISRVLATGLRLAVDLTAVRMLTLEAMGTVHQAFTVLALLAICDIGLPTGILSAYPRAEKGSRTHIARVTLLLLFAFAGAAALALASLAPVIAGFLGNQNIATVLIWGAGYLLITVMASGMESLLVASGKTASLIPASLLGSVVGFACVVWLLSEYSMPWCVIAGMAAGALLRFFYQTLAAFPLFAGSANGDTEGHTDGDIGSMVRLSLAVWLNRGLNLVTAWTDRVIVTLLFLPGQMAIYSIGAWELPFIGGIYGAIGQASLPRMSKMWAENDVTSLLKSWHETARKMGWLIFPLWAFALVWADEIITTVFTSAYADSAPIFRIYTLLMPIRVAIWSSLLIAINAKRSLILGSAVDVVINLCISVALIPLWGLWAPAIGTVLGTYVQVAIYFRVATRTLCVPWARLMPWRSLAISAYISVALVAPTTLLELTGLDMTLSLPIAGAWFAMSWAGVIWWQWNRSGAWAGTSARTEAKKTEEKKMKVVLCHDKEQWQAKCSSLNFLFFGQVQWVEFVAKTFGATPCYLTVETDDGLVVAALALLEKRTLGLKKIFTPPFGPYGDLAISSMAEEGGTFYPNIVAALTHYGRKAGYCRWAFAPALKETEPWEKSGWSVTQRQTRHIYIGSQVASSTGESAKEKLWGGLSRSARKQIRKAERLGTTVEIKVPKEKGFSESIKGLVQMSVATSKVQGFDLPCTPEILRRALERLAECSSIKLFIARDMNENTLASAMIGYDSHVAYDLWAGTSDAGREVGAASLLRWEILVSLVGKMDTFEFNGANIPSVARFKAGFGGELVPYFQFERTPSSLLRLLTAARKVFS